MTKYYRVIETSELRYTKGPTYARNKDGLWTYFDHCRRCWLACLVGTTSNMVEITEEQLTLELFE